MNKLLDKDNLIFNPPELECVLYLPGLAHAGGTVQDRSAYGNSAARIGAAWERLPSGLWYLHFDGVDDYLDVGTRPSALPDAFTVELWARFTSFPAADYFVGWHDTTGYPALGIDDSKYIMWLGANNFRYFSATSPVDADNGNQWYHFAWTCPGSNQDDIDSSALYINGQKQDVVSTAKAGGQSEKNTLTIGKRAGYNKYNGDIALVRIGNRVRNALQAQSDFHREKYLFGVW